MIILIVPISPIVETFSQKVQKNEWNLASEDPSLREKLLHMGQRSPLNTARMEMKSLILTWRCETLGRQFHFCATLALPV